MINKTGLHNDIDYVLLDQETLQSLRRSLQTITAAKTLFFFAFLRVQCIFSAILFANSMIIARLIFSQFQVTAMQEKLPE